MTWFIHKSQRIFYSFLFFLTLAEYSTVGVTFCSTDKRYLGHFPFLCYYIIYSAAPTPVLLPGKSHGWRSLVGCSPRGREESDTTERLHFHALEKEMATHSSVLAWRIPGTGEPDGLPSMGVAQSRTRLKWLSSSSCIQCCSESLWPYVLVMGIDIFVE